MNALADATNPVTVALLDCVGGWMMDLILRTDWSARFHVLAVAGSMCLLAAIIFGMV
jgi:hypothetical protein